MVKDKSPLFKIPGNIITLYSQIAGPKDTKTLKMILDTGASYTMIPVRKAIDVGYDPAVAPERIQIFTVSGTDYVPKIKVGSFKCLGFEISGLEVLCHDLPPQSPADGLLGLNFLTHLPSFFEFIRSLGIMPSSFSSTHRPA